MSKAKPRDLALYLRVLRESRAYWPHLGLAFGLELLTTPLLLLAPVPLKLVVDHVLGTAPLPGWAITVLPEAARATPLALLAAAALLQVTVVVVAQLRDLASHVLSTRVGEGLVRDFRARLFRHVQDLSLYFHDTRGTGSSIFRIQYDAPAIQYITLHGFLPFVTAALTLVATVAVIARIDLQLALVALLVAPSLLFVFRAFRERIRRGHKDAAALESSAFDVVQEVLGSLRVVKAFGRETSEQQRYERRSGAGARARIGLAATEGLFGFLVNLTTAMGTAAVLWVGARSVLAGTVTLGDLLLVLAYLGQLYSPLKTVSKTAATLQSSLTCAERSFQLLDEVPEVRERPGARGLGRARGEIELRSVSFAYPEKPPVLDDVSFRLPAGSRVGVIGRTGAGKTTLVSLITRFYDPTAGAVLLDGVDLRDLRLADLRSQFAIVLQEPVLFSTSIAENIAYARPEASAEEIAAAARAAGADGFIRALPEGYATCVGERGMKLSGGERQRVSLARAFLKDAPIVILDEPTSSVDVATETAILAAMERLMEGRTTILIAHRASTIERCRVLLRVADGGVTIAEPVPAALGDLGMGGGR